MVMSGSPAPGEPCLVPCRVRSRRSASMRSAWSIWWQVALKFVRDGAEVGAAGGAVLHEPGGLGLVEVGSGAGVDAEPVLEVAVDDSGVDEQGQVPGQGRFL